jgi:hypothetical protein
MVDCDSEQTPCFSGETGLPALAKTCHDQRMSKRRRLLDIYRFSGFVPVPTIRSLFGDPLAVVITQRRSLMMISFHEGSLIELDSFFRTVLEPHRSIGAVSRSFG